MRYTALIRREHGINRRAIRQFFAAIDLALTFLRIHGEVAAAQRVIRVRRTAFQTHERAGGEHALVFPNLGQRSGPLDEHRDGKEGEQGRFHDAEAF